MVFHYEFSCLDVSVQQPRFSFVLLCVFRQAFDLLEFDIQELEESLLLMGTEDDTTQLVLRLVIKLLKGCSRTFTNNINEDVSFVG